MKHSEMSIVGLFNEKKMGGDKKPFQEKTILAPCLPKLLHMIKQFPISATLTFYTTVVAVMLAVNVKPVGAAESAEQIAGYSSDVIKDLGDSVSVGRGPEELNAKADFIQFNKDGASVTFELRCDPEKQNYLTVKLWGGSGSSGSRLNVSTVGGRNLYKNKSNRNWRWGRLIKQNSSNPVPGRFFYATAALPKELVDESPASVKLTYRGDKDKPGYKLFGVRLHTDPYYEPDEDELQGEPFELGPPRPGETPTRTEQIDYWRSQANRAFEWSRNKQIFGERAENFIENGDCPEWTRGAITYSRAWSELPPGFDQMDSDVMGYGSWLIFDSGRFRHAFYHMALFAHAYVHEWSDYYQSEEMLERFVAAMDFYSLAQGTRGTFQGPEVEITEGTWRPAWQGAPDRGSHAAAALLPYSQYMYKAYNMLHEDLETKGYLYQPFPHDLDPEFADRPLRG